MITCPGRQTAKIGDNKEGPGVFPESFKKRYGLNGTVFRLQRPFEPVQYYNLRQGGTPHPGPAAAVTNSNS